MGKAGYSVDSGSVEQTRAIGGRLGAALQPGDVIALIGGLGSGKTQFVKGVATGVGVADPNVVTSPTFVIVHEYPGRVYLYHVDAYRLSGSAELSAIGIEEMFSRPAAVIIEWADRVPAVLPDDRLVVRLALTGPHQRRIDMDATGPTARRLLAALDRPC